MNAMTRITAMDPQFLTQAMEQRQRLIEERNELDRQIRLLSDFIEAQERTLAARPGSSVSPIRDTHAPQRQRNSLRPKEIGAIARDILREAGRPMTRGQLLSEFDQRGIEIVGGDRAKVLGTIMWRLKREDGTQEFRNTPNGYWPSDMPLPR